jgi:hypothetical protein
MFARAWRIPLSLLLLPPWLLLYFRDTTGICFLVGGRFILPYVGIRPVLILPPFSCIRISKSLGDMLSRRHVITIVTPRRRRRRTIIAEVPW